MVVHQGDVPPVGCSASGMDAANHTRSYRMLYRHVVEVGRTARRPWRIYRHDSPAARKRNVGCNQMLDYDRRGIEYMLDVRIRGSQRTKADQCGTRVGRECENAERAATLVNTQTITIERLTELNNQIIETYQNNANLKILNLFQENTLRYNFSRKIDLTANLNFQNIQFNNNTFSTNLFLINPSIYFNIKKTGFGNFSFSFSENNSLPEINQLTTNYQLTDYRSFLQGTTFQKPLKNQTISLNYSYYNDEKRFSINTNIFYSNSKSILNTSSNLTSDFNFNSYIQTKGSESYNFNFSLVNYSRKLKLASKIETLNNWITSPLNVNSTEFSNAKSFSNSIKYSATTYFKSKINFDFGFSYNYFQSNFQSIKTTNTTKDAFLNINYKVSKTILAESNNSLYYVNNKNYSFNNLVLSYTPLYSKFSYRLIVNNLVNENQYTYISINNYSYYQSIIQLVPRYVLGTIKYRF